MDIKFSVDHDYGKNSYLLIGDYNGVRFVEGVLDKFWGIPLRYKKWLIRLKFNIINQ